MKSCEINETAETENSILYMITVKHNETDSEKIRFDQKKLYKIVDPKYNILKLFNYYLFNGTFMNFFEEILLILGMFVGFIGVLVSNFNVLTLIPIGCMYIWTIGKFFFYYNIIKKDYIWRFHTYIIDQERMKNEFDEFLNKI